MRVLITGATGFVGSHLSEALLARGDEVHGAVPNPAMASRMGEAAGRVCLQRCDVTDPDQVAYTLATTRPELVFHLAGVASVAASIDAPTLTFRVNAMGSLVVLEALRAMRKPPRLILVSTGDVYGSPAGGQPLDENAPLAPTNSYGVAKAAADLMGYQYFRNYGLPVIRVRPFNHTGPGQGTRFVCSDWAHQVAAIEVGRADPVVRVGNLETRRDFLHVLDVVDAYLLLAEHGEPGAVYNVASGEARRVGDVLAWYLARATVPVRVETDPGRGRPTDTTVVVGDSSRLRALGWTPRRRLEEALEALLEEARRGMRRA
ncbi:MAG: GDP-mannose 4,6-dehydratase [Planctomycetes bacterium]|nr:GDP-mannose 4,6-dehydratase [Planctomycetota bacterium]